jgi:hypothetical protein
VSVSPFPIPGSHSPRTWTGRDRDVSKDDKSRPQFPLFSGIQIPLLLLPSPPSPNTTPLFQFQYSPVKRFRRDTFGEAEHKKMNSGLLKYYMISWRRWLWR